MLRLSARVGLRNGVISGRNSIKSGPSFARSCQAGMGLGSCSGSCQEELLVISHDDETYDAAAVTESPRLLFLVFRSLYDEPTQAVSSRQEQQPHKSPFHVGVRMFRRPSCGLTALVRLTIPRLSPRQSSQDFRFSANGNVAMLSSVLTTNRKQSNIPNSQSGPLARRW